MLKNVLSLLLSKFYSKQESELVGHQAMPSSSVVRLTPKTTTIDGWDSVFDGVASTDGFACLRFTADSVYCIASAQTENINVFTTPQVAGDILLCACPVAKGQVFTLCARQAKNIECWFTKTIGGGYQTLKKLILQGGGLCCLKHSYSSLRRSSWLAKSLGFTKIPSLLRTTLSPCFQVRQEFQNEATQRRLMEWPLSLLEKHRPKIFPVSWMSTVSGDNSSKTLNKVGKLIRLFTSLKATFFTWQQGAVIQRSVSSCSIPRPNLTVGGASC